jgi:serine/threonine protein kinase
MSALLKPTAEDIAAIESPYAQTMMESIHWAGMCESWEEACPRASSDGLDLLRSLLQFNPSKRATVDAALAHPFVNQFSQLWYGYVLERWSNTRGDLLCFIIVASLQ